MVLELRWTKNIILSDKKIIKQLILIKLFFLILVNITNNEYELK